jgi:hypothetical protein
MAAQRFDNRSRAVSEELDMLRQMAARRSDSQEIVRYGLDFHLGFAPAHRSYYLHIHFRITLD